MKGTQGYYVSLAMVLVLLTLFLDARLGLDSKPSAGKTWRQRILDRPIDISMWWMQCFIKVPRLDLSELLPGQKVDTAVLVRHRTPAN